MADEKTIIKQLATQRTRAQFKADSFDAEARTVEVTFATETAVRTFDWDSWENIDEILICTPEAGDLTRLNSGAPVLDNHNRYGKTAESVVGVVESARFEGGIGIAKLRFGNTEDDSKLMEKVKDGIVTGVSVGYNVQEYQVTRSDGQTPVYKATKWTPTEISFTPVQADVNSRSRSEGESTNDVTIHDVTPEKNNNPVPPVVENTAEENSEEPENETNNETNQTMTEDERKAAEAATRSEAAKAERIRISGIQNSVRILGLPADFAETLIEEGVSVDVASTRALAEWEKSNPVNPTQNKGQQQTENEQTRSAMTNALVLRINPAAASVMGDDNVRAAAEFRSMNFLRLAEESLVRSGVKTAGLSAREIAKGALGGKIRGMHHTSDFPLLLGDTINRTLLAKYQLQQRTFTAWAKRNTVSDFRTVTRVRVSDLIGDLELVREGGEYKHGTMGEGGESYKLAKYGKIISITWEAIVNDDLSAFTTIPQSFAAKAAQKQSNIVYDILLLNPVMSDNNTLFKAAHGNYTGTAGNLATGGTALSEASLTTAFELFLTQKDEAGQFINVTPKFLIVGPKNSFLAQKMTSSNFTPATQSDVPVGALTGLTVIVEPRITSYEWFLAADPNMVDTIEYSFLDGEEELFTEQREGFDIDGVQVKARMVFAAKAIDWRGLYRNNGAAPA